MSLFVESGIEFDFSRTISVVEHDKSSPSLPGVSSADGNTTWPGCDFRIEDASGWIWLEVKIWEPGRIDPKRRGGSRHSFNSKMRSKPFCQEMRGKFLGTAAYLAWDSRFLLAPTRFLLLFEPRTRTEGDGGRGENAYTLPFAVRATQPSGCGSAGNVSA